MNSGCANWKTAALNIRRRPYLPLLAVNDSGHVEETSAGESKVVDQLAILANEIRLHILLLLGEEEELPFHDIMAQLQEHNQTAILCHLQQLVTHNYVIAHCRHGTWCYRLNRRHIVETFDMLARFLLLK